jgi:4-amino-4-deoxy-L-arabinose transferase-like glycosyltransferase
MTPQRSLLIVLAAGIATLAIGTAPTPLWDEDEPRFAAIARAMVETGDWVVPMFNGQLAVDKPVLMHWCMAASMTVFGTNEFAARLPSMIAALVAALAVLRIGTRLFDPTVGMIAALAWLGTILSGIEAHAATPDAILTALCSWAVVLAVEVMLGGSSSVPSTVNFPRLGIARASLIGLLLGLAVVCKGPIGFVGPLAVLLPWALWVAIDRRVAPAGAGSWFSRVASNVIPAAFDVLRSLRPIVITLAAIAAAAPWYVAVWQRTNGAWIEGFFFVHNVGRFMAPMEKHGGGMWYHPVTMLVCFYPWSCFLPLSLVLATWRVWRRAIPETLVPAVGLLLVWFAVWVGGFSLAATKLPNYVLPAYPAAALIVGWVVVDAARRAAATGHWPHRRWIAFGMGGLVFGGIATSATVIVATQFGAPGAEPAAVVGLVPLVGAIICWRLAATGQPLRAVNAFAATSLVFTALAVGPGSTIIARANTIPGFVRAIDASAPDRTRLGTFTIASPNIVFYADQPVHQILNDDVDNAVTFLASSPDAVLLVPEQKVKLLEESLPPGHGIIGRTRPLFRPHDVVAIGKMPPGDRTAGTNEVPR